MNNLCWILFAENQALPTFLSSPLYCGEESYSSQPCQWTQLDSATVKHSCEVLRTEEKSLLFPKWQLQTRMWCQQMTDMAGDSPEAFRLPPEGRSPLHAEVS